MEILYFCLVSNYYISSKIYGYKMNIKDESDVICQKKRGDRKAHVEHKTLQKTSSIYNRFRAMVDRRKMRQIYVKAEKTQICGRNERTAQ